MSDYEVETSSEARFNDHIDWLMCSDELDAEFHDRQAWLCQSAFDYCHPDPEDDALHEESDWMGFVWLLIYATIPAIFFYVLSGLLYGNFAATSLAAGIGTGTFMGVFVGASLRRGN